MILEGLSTPCKKEKISQNAPSRKENFAAASLSSTSLRTMRVERIRARAERSVVPIHNGKIG